MDLELTPANLLSTLHSLSPYSYTASPLNVLVAFSGGLDSHVLLHLLSQVSEDEIKLRAVYVNHGLQAEAHDWDKHCATVCQNLQIPYQSIELNLMVVKGESLEDIARKARYLALAENILKDEMLVTAHHQNDQAETLLLQLFRGAGVQGLAAMPIQSEFNYAKNFHARPLLHYSRESLKAYANKHALAHIEDPSNQDTRFDRNYLRNDIMPLLRDRWLGVDKTIARAASIQAETKTLLDEMAASLLPAVLTQTHYYAESLPQNVLAPIELDALDKLSQVKQRLVLRYWISKQGFNNPSDTKLAHIFSNLVNTANDKQPLVEWSGVQLRRYQNRLYIMSPLSKHDGSQVIVWEGKTSLNIEPLSLLIKPSEVEFVDNEKLTIRFRQGGEKIALASRGNISLKNYFQELYIPPWMRSRLPLVFKGEKLVKIVGLVRYKRHPPTF